MRIAQRAAAVATTILSIGLWSTAGLVPSAAAATGDQCTTWTSRDQPPPDISVYRVSEGTVERVDFQLYVARVVSKEWNVRQLELRNAGAVAAKQYAWYHVLHWRGGTFNGKCFDVRDTTQDQLYAATPADQLSEEVWESVRATWKWQVFRDGKFIMTGYRQGDEIRCAKDAVGFRLYARSARDCVQQRHWDAKRVLEVYYSADLLR